MTSSVRVGTNLSLTSREAFDFFVDELTLALGDRGMRFDEVSSGGKIVQGGEEVATVQEFVTGESISFLWRPKTWDKKTFSKLLVTFQPDDVGVKVSVELQDWSRVMGDEGREMLGWFVGEVVAPLLAASAPNRLGDWITDRNARRPSGTKARHYYSNPIHHWPNFLAILDTIVLSPKDYLLEVGCGGGAFLHEALKTGCRASAIDHSPDMVRLATQANLDAINENRLKIVTGEADQLPFAAGIFTCVVMTGVLGFLPNALQAFREVYRVLGKGGRFVAFTGSKELSGTPAAPEPIASRLHFYEDSELQNIARLAGFAEASVEHPSLFEFAKRAGVAESDLDLFRGTNSSQLLVARKT